MHIQVGHGYKADRCKPTQIQSVPQNVGARKNRESRGTTCKNAYGRKARFFEKRCLFRGLLASSPQHTTRHPPRSTRKKARHIAAKKGLCCHTIPRLSPCPCKDREKRGPRVSRDQKNRKHPSLGRQGEKRRSDAKESEVDGAPLATAPPLPRFELDHRRLEGTAK